MDFALILLIFLAVVFDFINGVHDSSNIVATMITSRAFHPRVALGVTAIAHFVAPFMFGVAVATTIGADIVDASEINDAVIIAALLSAITWNLATWYFGLPSSSSHALIGGLVGAVLIAGGTGAIYNEGLITVLLALILSPIIGFLLGFFFTKLVLFLSRGATPRINWFFKRSQLITAITLAFSHGTNDAQKTMGIITLGLVTSGIIETFYVPLWVVTISATAIALGTAMGGWRLIKTLGARFYKIKPMDAFNSQVASTTVILGASFIGGPVSTTQVVSSSIMGVGSAERLSKVRWGVAGDLAIAWLITLPLTALLAAGIYWIIVQLSLL
jgi:PiT family inorganic phosphate transporter